MLQPVRGVLLCPGSHIHIARAWWSRELVLVTVDGDLSPAAAQHFPGCLFSRHGDVTALAATVGTCVPGAVSKWSISFPLPSWGRFPGLATLTPMLWWRGAAPEVTNCPYHRMCLPKSFGQKQRG